MFVVLRGMPAGAAVFTTAGPWSFSTVLRLEAFTNAASWSTCCQGVLLPRLAGVYHRMDADWNAQDPPNRSEASAADASERFGEK